MRTPLLFLAVGLTSLALIAAGCGGDDDDGGGGSSDSSGSQGNGVYGDSGGASDSGGGGGVGSGATKLTLVADPGGALKFDKTELRAKPGKVTITMDNPSSVPHAVEVEGKGVEKETKTLTNGKASLTVDVKAGDYEFYCPVDGHKEAGMEGTLTVN